MIRFFKKLFKRGDFMTRADKAYYKYRAKTIFWSAFCMIIIAWVGTNLVLCALTTNVTSNFDMIYEAEQPTVLPIGKDVNVAIMNKKTSAWGGGDVTVDSVTFDKYNSDGGYMVGDVDIVAACNTPDKMVKLNDDVTLYRMGNEKVINSYKGVDVYILSNKQIQANPDSSFMFYCLERCTSYTFNNFDTSLVTNMMGMFAGDNTWGSSAFEGRTKTATTSSVGARVEANNKAHTFAGPAIRDAYTPEIQNLDLSDWNTSNVTNMYGMFLYCYALEELNFAGWDTSKVTDMGKTFHFNYVGLASIKTLDLSSFDTSSVQNYDDVFPSYASSYFKTVYVSERWNIPASVLPSGCSYVQKEYTGK